MSLWSVNSANSFIKKLESNSRKKNQHIAPKHLLTYVPEKKPSLVAEMHSIARHLCIPESMRRFIS